MDDTPTEIDPVNPWDQLPDEPDKTFGYFRHYMAMDRPRSLRVIGDLLGYSHITMRRHSCKWEWIRRAEAWDLKCDLADSKVTIEEVTRKRRKHLSALDKVIARGTDKLDALEDHIDEMRPSDARAMVIEGIKTQQLLLGEATERTEIVGEQWDLSVFTVDELKLLKSMRARALHLDEGDDA
jgi:hypothetical protein